LDNEEKSEGEAFYVQPRSATKTAGRGIFLQMRFLQSVLARLSHPDGDAWAAKHNWNRFSSPTKQFSRQRVSPFWT